MVKVSRYVRSNQKLTEVRNTKHGPECAAGMFENFLSMSHEQKAGLSLLLLEEPFEIKGGHHRLSCPVRSHNQIAPVSVARRSDWSASRILS